MVDQSDDSRFLTERGLAMNIAELIEGPIEALGFRLVRVHVLGGKEQTLQVMAERPDGTMNVADCEKVSRQLSPLLDAHDPVPGAYRLEVSSPGIDRPLVRPDDFESWAGYAARIEMNTLIDGRRRFKGRLEGCEDREVRIEVDLGAEGVQVLGLPFEFIHEARLILTDELIRESLRRAKLSGAAVDDTVTDVSEDPPAEDDDEPMPASTRH